MRGLGKYLPGLALLLVGIGCDSSPNGERDGSAAFDAAATVGDSGADGSISFDAATPVGDSGEDASVQRSDTCRNADECSLINPLVCDPRRLACGPAECTGAVGECPDGQDCFAQGSRLARGACYTTCSPGSSSCSAGLDCVSTSPDGAAGVCMWQDEAAEGDPCASSDVSTGCGPDLRCTPDTEGAVCRHACDFFSSAPSCPDGQRCSMSGTCVARPGTDVPIGASCGLLAEMGALCGDDGSAWRGACTDVGGSRICAMLCRTTASDCGATSAQCYLEFPDALEIGVCVDRLECGDGGVGYADCVTCLDTATAAGGCCASEAEACFAGTPCAAFTACIDSCDSVDDACAGHCIDDFPNGVVPALRWRACVDGDPDQRFPGACGIICPQPEDDDQTDREGVGDAAVGP